MNNRYLLDTNILVHLARNDFLGQRIVGHYDLLYIQPVPVYSVVTEGEILSIALRNSWGHNLSRLEYLLDYFECQFIDERKLAAIYAMLDSETQGWGFKMGKNDLWIAATAYTYDLTLLTTDRDFDPIANVFIQRDWIDPHSSVILPGSP